jgi:predicted acetyltransferase
VHPEIQRATPQDRLPLYRMLELYQYELSDIWDQELDVHGEYGYALDRFWTDVHSKAYLIKVAGNYAGFALVDDRVKIPGGRFWMDQFFVMKKYRRTGIGRLAALAMFREHIGMWQVGQMPENFAAQNFWRQVIAEYKAGDFSETQITSGWWQGVVQSFTSSYAVQSAPTTHG